MVARAAGFGVGERRVGEGPRELRGCSTSAVLAISRCTYGSSCREHERGTTVECRRCAPRGELERGVASRRHGWLGGVSPRSGSGWPAAGVAQHELQTSCPGNGEACARKWEDELIDWAACDIAPLQIRSIR